MHRINSDWRITRSEWELASSAPGFVRGLLFHERTPRGADRACQAGTGQQENGAFPPSAVNRKGNRRLPHGGRGSRHLRSGRRPQPNHDPGSERSAPAGTRRSLRTTSHIAVEALAARVRCCPKPSRFDDPRWFAFEARPLDRRGCGVLWLIEVESPGPVPRIRAAWRPRAAERCRHTSMYRPKN